MIQFKKGSQYPQPVGGFIVPKEFITNCSLITLERILGFMSGRLKQGAIFVQLNSLPAANELEYYGDTRTPAHQFDEKKNPGITKEDLSSAAYAYLQPSTKLIKVIPVDDPFSLNITNQNWPSGQGAMQYKLKEGIRKNATVIEVINDYLNGIFIGL